MHYQAADGRAQQRADEGGDDDEVHRPEQFGFREGAHDGQAPDRHHHGAAQALQQAGGGHHLGAHRQAAQDRSAGEDADRGEEDAAGAEAVGHPAADGNADGQAEDVAGDDRFQAQRGNPEAGSDAGNGGVDDRGVELLHE